MTKREAIVKACRDAKGTPWRHEGRLPGLGGGLDCIGVLCLAAAASGDLTPEVAAEIPAYGPLPKVKIFLPFMKNHLVQIRKEDLKPGDVLMVCVKSWPMHVGIVGDGRDGLTMIHADALFKRVIEQKLDDKVVVHSYYRFPSLAREEA